VHGNEMRPGDLSNVLGLTQPLLVRSNLVLGHGTERIHLVRKPPHERNLRNEVRESQKRSAPRLDEHDVAVFSQHPLHLVKSLLEILRQSGQMVQAPPERHFISRSPKTTCFRAASF
jgi:hypothetical protein